MKLESVVEIILTYVLLVTIWVFFGKNLSQSVAVLYWSFLLLPRSVSWSCWCIRSTTDLFHSFHTAPKGELISLKLWKMKTVFIHLHLTALALSRQPDFSSFPLAGWWCGSLAKKKVWQRNPCPYGGRQPLGCRYAYVRVHWHALLHTVFTSAGFLAKFQGHRYLLAVSWVDFAVGTSRRSLVVCFAAFLVLPKEFIQLCQ